MTQPSIQTTILRNLLNNDQYTRQVIPHLKKDYFEGIHRSVFDHIVSFVGKYNKLPNAEALMIDMQDSNVTDGQYADATVVINEIAKKDDVNYDWLIEHTEKWCQDRAIYLAIMESINIIDGKHETLAKNALPQLLQDALGVSFDNSVGHDYIIDALKRYEFYHEEHSRIPFDLEIFNEITKGGLPNKTLNVFMAPPHAGKTIFMCHIAAAAMAQGKDVLYITMEMAEEEISRRIDANLLNVSIEQVEQLSKDMFESKISKLQAKTNGSLIVKQFPTGAAHAGHFRALLNEIKLKKKIKPQLVCIDYLNICSSARMKGLGGSINTYSLIKSIAEEIRGLAIEFDLPIVSATQTNKDGFENSEVDITNTSESFGLPATADAMWAIVRTKELTSLGQVMIKQLKNRYTDLDKKNRFILGLDKSKMKLYEVEDSAQTLIDTTPTYTNDEPINSFGNRERKDFTNFKM